MKPTYLHNFWVCERSLRSKDAENISDAARNQETNIFVPVIQEEFRHKIQCQLFVLTGIVLILRHLLKCFCQQLETMGSHQLTYNERINDNNAHQQYIHFNE